MLYYETSDRSNKLAGAIAVVVYLLVLLTFMLFMRFTFKERDDGGGILINFGDTESASGLGEPIDSPVAHQQQTDPFGEPNELITQDFEDAPAINQPDRPTQQQNIETTPIETPREVNQQALFPGRTTGSASTSEGTAAQGTGNQGALHGSAEGSHDGTGAAGSGMGFNLSGRSVMGALTSPTYGANKSGRVVMQIVVDASGAVVSATYRTTGSTTTDGELVSAAEKAALKSRFNKIEGDGLQTGTITYNFKLK